MNKNIKVNGIIVGSVPATGNYHEYAVLAQKFLKEKKLLKNISLVEQMFNQANAFAKVSKEIYDRGLSKIPYQVELFSPFIVNASFSIEIYMKTILTIFGNTAKGHSHKNLYKKLPEECKLIFHQCVKDIAPVYNLDRNINIEVLLLNSEKAFENWRYLYEKNKLYIKINELYFLINVAFEACCRIKENKKL